MVRTNPDTGDGLVLGGDIGGTSTRLVVADLSGRVVARATGPGGNPVAHPQTARQALADALAEATADVDPGAVLGGVVGMAGGGAMRDPAARAAYDGLWRRAGLRILPEICSDLEVAFAAGTQALAGSVLVAGTGAVAGRILDHRLVGTVGGHGWLLGDEGSGFWIGREAVRVALRTLEGTGPDGVLSRSVLDRLGASKSGTDQRASLIAAVHELAPVTLSALAPLVSGAHDSGDVSATEILDLATAHLLHTWDRLDGTRRGDPVVLAGSPIAAGSYLGNALRAGLRERGATPCTAEDPALGAVRLALRRLEVRQGP